MTYLLDTNIVSELRKPQPNSNVLAWYSTVRSAELFLSALTIGEIRIGIERLRRRDRSQADRIEEWVTNLYSRYKDRIIDVDVRVAEEWGRLNVPDPLPVIDGLLAASASVRGWTLVTRNVADLERTGVALLNPFDIPGA
jgi:predicted nucleic acid-binding protein